MKLTSHGVQDRLKAHPGWALEGSTIRKLYTFKSFPDAIAFVTRLAFDCEKADHHPDLQVSYKKVTVSWTTHDAGGLTAMDFAGAEQSDMMAARMLDKG